MLLKGDFLAERLETPRGGKPGPLVITPSPDVKNVRDSGSASIDLRLGCWFLAFRQSRVPILDVYARDEESVPKEPRLAKKHYVAFGDRYIVQPRAFVLGTTLEWVKLPGDMGAYVVGKSSWGRHGLIIATATGVHPGFSGCLTLEISNVGEVPIAIWPGTQICQIFFHTVDTKSPEKADQSDFIGMRKPTVSAITLQKDPFARALIGKRL